MIPMSDYTGLNRQGVLFYDFKAQTQRQLAGEDVGSQSIARVGVRAQVDNDVGVLRALGHGFYEVRQE